MNILGIFGKHTITAWQTIQTAYGPKKGPEWLIQGCMVVEETSWFETRTALRSSPPPRPPFHPKPGRTWSREPWFDCRPDARQPSSRWRASNLSRFHCLASFA